MVVDEEWQKENLRDLEGPWNPGGLGGDNHGGQGWWLFSPARRNATFTNAHVSACEKLTNFMTVLTLYSAHLCRMPLFRWDFALR